MLATYFRLLLVPIGVITLVKPSLSQDIGVDYYQENITYNAVQENVLQQIRMESSLRSNSCRIGEWFLYFLV